MIFNKFHLKTEYPNNSNSLKSRNYGLCSIVKTEPQGLLWSLKLTMSTNWKIKFEKENLQ